MFLYREEPSTHFFGRLLSSSLLSPLFPKVLFSGNHPKQEGFSLEAAASFPWLLPAGLEGGQSL